jgi:PAS domain S-box-containing protein
MKRSKFIGFGLLTTVAYIATARIGLSLAFVAEQVTVVWPPTGIALCAVLLLGYRIWPFIAAGAFVANILTNAPPLTSLGITTGNTLEAVIGAWLLNRFIGFRPSLERFRDVFGLIFFGAGISTMVSATVGVISLCATGVQQWEHFGELWGVWFLGDGMGDVLVAPLVLSLACTDYIRRIQSRLPEFIGLISVLVALDFFVFGGLMAESSYLSPHYATLPILIWAAWRFGIAGNAIGAFMTAGISILGTARGFGPFTTGDVNENLISLQLFMFTASLTGLLMAVSESGRDRAQTSLRGSEERYRSLVLASSQVVWSTTAGGDVIEDLPTWRAFTGQTKEEMIGRGWMTMLHPDDIKHVTEVWEHSLKTRTPHENEFRVKAADGTYRNVYARTSPVMETDGGIREWVGTLTDITDRKRAEHEMQVANQRKDEFLAMLAHELRNPLAPIRNAVEIIRMSKDDPARIDWTCEIMVRQVHHMSRLLDDLLDVSRITRGQIHLSKHSTDLKMLVERSLEAARPVIEKRQLRLMTEFADGPVPIFADSTRIEQVITNLVNNAVKFTAAGGKITVIVERDRDTAVLRVLDTGRGISAELLPRIFDLFTQGDISLARSEGGLGIGLTLVQSLVRMHSGQVDVKSAGPGHGSEFIVRMPMLPVVPLTAAKKSERRSIPTREKRRVLVIEDNVDSAETLAAMLDVLGHEAHIAHDGMAGLELFSRLKPSAVLLDIGLPGISGFEVAERLRASKSGNDVKIIALTGYGSESDRERGKAAGFDHHLIKPVDFDVLEKLLQQ